MLHSRKSKRRAVLENKANLVFEGENVSDSKVSHFNCSNKPGMTVNLRKGNKKNNQNMSKENQPVPRKSRNIRSQTPSCNAYKLSSLSVKEDPMKTDISKKRAKQSNVLSTLSNKVCQPSSKENFVNTSIKKECMKIKVDSESKPPRVLKKRLLSEKETGTTQNSKKSINQNTRIKRLQKSLRDSNNSRDKENVSSKDVENQSNAKTLKKTELPNKGVKQNRISTRSVSNQPESTNPLVFTSVKNIKIKQECSMSNTNIKSIKKEPVSNSIIKRESQTKVFTNCLQKPERVPIWRKAATDSSVNRSKRLRKSDVYNISWDKDLMSENCPVKKKRKKANNRKKMTKPKVFSIKMNPCPFELRKIKSEHITVRKTVLKTNAGKTDIYKETPYLFQTDPNLDDQYMTDIPENVQDLQIDNSRVPHYYTFERPLSPFVPNDKAKIIEKNNTTPEKKEVNSKEKYIRNLQDMFNEFEASFSMPTMTSTPQTVNKTCNIVVPHENVAVRKISTIPPIVPLVADNNISDTEFLSPEKEAPCDFEFSLFESPPKVTSAASATQPETDPDKLQMKLFPGKEKVRKENRINIENPKLKNPCKRNAKKNKEQDQAAPLPKKAFRQNEGLTLNDATNKPITTKQCDEDTEIVLFDSPEDDKGKENLELCTSPAKGLAVLKPAKSYHSTAQVKKYVALLKKEESKPKKKKLTREDKLIQQMNEHFSEIDSMELYIE